MLNEPFIELKNKVSKFVQEDLIPSEQLLSKTKQVPETIIKQMKKMGLYGITIAQEFGGLDLSLKQEIELMYIFGKTSPVFQFQFGTNQGIGSYLLSGYGSLSLKQKYLPKIASGDIVSSFCITEEGAGSDVKSIKATAVFKDGVYILNAQKRYISNAPIANIFIVVAKIINDKQEDLFTIFLVERCTKGVTVFDADNKLGHDGALTAKVSFENVLLKPDSIIGEPGQGLKLAYQNISKGKLIISSLAIGTAQRLLSDSVVYAKNRIQFGQPISSFQLIQGMLADMYTEIFAAKSMIESITNSFFDDKATAKNVASCKYFTSEMVNRVADKALQIHGGQGYMQGNIERFFRDVRLFKIYEGTSQIQQLFIANRLLKGTT